MSSTFFWVCFFEFGMRWCSPARPNWKKKRKEKKKIKFLLSFLRVSTKIFESVPVLSPVLLLPEKRSADRPQKGVFVRDIPRSLEQTWTLKSVEFWIFYSTMQAIRQPLIKKAERKISIWKALKRNVHGFTLSVNLLGFIRKESFWWKSLSFFIFIHVFFFTTVLVFFPFSPAIRE